MTGDGVNDVLRSRTRTWASPWVPGRPPPEPLPSWCCSTTALPPSPASEGRRVINNIERVANLFITKAAYVLLTALVGIAGSPFPFLPRQLTLSSFSIGLPGFFLALPRTSRSSARASSSGSCAFASGRRRRRGRHLRPVRVVRRLDDIHRRGPHRRHDDPAGDWAHDPRVDQSAAQAVEARPRRRHGRQLRPGDAIPFGRDYFELDLPTTTAWYGAAASVIARSASGLQVACSAPKRPTEPDQLREPQATGARAPTGAPDLVPESSTDRFRTAQRLGYGLRR